MKHILLFLMLCVMSLVANAQVQYRYGVSSPDTSAASATHYIYIGGTSIATATKFREAGDLEVLIRADSLSGATAGTITLQVAYDDSAAPNWYDAATLTVNGATALYSRTQLLNFTGLKVRARIVNTGATQSNRMIVAHTWKRRV